MTENDKKMKISIIHLSKAAENGEHDISKYMYMILNFPALFMGVSTFFCPSLQNFYTITLTIICLVGPQFQKKE